MKRRNLLSDFNISDEDKRVLVDEIMTYFERERDEEIGIIASEDILEFFIDTLGKFIYNKALDDSMVWFKNRMENIESDYYTMYKQ